MSRRPGIASEWETPPHTWRKSCNPEDFQLVHRNTSTYVEKMARDFARCLDCWKHLHIRGENTIKFFSTDTNLETPPHTWRKS